MRYQLKLFTWNPATSVDGDLNAKQGSRKQKCMHLPISTPIHWYHGIIHNFEKLPFEKVGYSGTKILLSRRWACKWRITPPDLQEVCLSNGIWLWHSHMSMRLLRVKNTFLLVKYWQFNFRGTPVELSFTSQEGCITSLSPELRFALGVRSFKSKLKNKQCKWAAD